MKTFTRSSGEVFGTGSFPIREPARDSRMLDEEFAATSDSDLESSIVSLNHHIDALHTELLLRIAEYDRRHAAEMRHGFSTSGWLWAGCSAPADWCDAHHVVPWSEGGPTDLDNLTLLCRTHHTRTHETTHRPVYAPDP